MELKGESECVRADDEEGDSDGLSRDFELLAGIEVVNDASALGEIGGAGWARRSVRGSSCWWQVQEDFDWL